MSIQLTKCQQVSLRDHPGFSEKWLEDQIVEDPAVLGLGDLAVIDRQRRQPKAGRLDLLLEEAGADRRFEVELMLGRADESHIIRTIEYWDSERRRYPGYEHVAVLVAEDITSRFLNVLGLFSGSIPLVALQLTALQVGDQLALHFVKVIDQSQLRLDDSGTVEYPRTDRAYWVNRATEKTVAMTDRVLEWVNQTAKGAYRLNFNKHYIGLLDDHRSTNFVFFKPRKSYPLVGFVLDDLEGWATKADDANLSASTDKRRLRVTLKPSELDKNEGFVRELIAAALKKTEGE